MTMKKQLIKKIVEQDKARKLAVILDVAETTISRMRTGTYTPTYDKLFEYLNKLGFEIKISAVKKNDLHN